VRTDRRKAAVVEPERRRVLRQYLRRWCSAPGDPCHPPRFVRRAVTQDTQWRARGTPTACVSPRPSIRGPGIRPEIEKPRGTHAAPAQSSRERWPARGCSESRGSRANRTLSLSVCRAYDRPADRKSPELDAALRRSARLRLRGSKRLARTPDARDVRRSSRLGKWAERTSFIRHVRC
jgi:hypothetical protein